MSSWFRDGTNPSSLSSVVPAEIEFDRGRDGPASVTIVWAGLGDKGEIGGGGWKACNLGFELDSHRLTISFQLPVVLVMRHQKIQEGTY